MVPTGEDARTILPVPDSPGQLRLQPGRRVQGLLFGRGKNRPGEGAAGSLYTNSILTVVLFDKVGGY